MSRFLYFLGWFALGSGFVNLAIGLHSLPSPVNEIADGLVAMVLGVGCLIIAEVDR